MALILGKSIESFLLTDTFAAKVAAPQAQARMFIQEPAAEKESSSLVSGPSSAKLIDNHIPNVVTEVPSIEVPTKFEGLLDDPTIVFKSSSGSENRVNAKVIRRLKDKKSAMDRAREMLRKRLNTGGGADSIRMKSTTTPSPFINVVTTNPRGRPKAFSRLQSTNAGGGTTLSSLIQASTTVPPPTPNRNLSVRDKMVAARNRLRLLMGQGPIGITSTPRTMPTTPTPSTPTKMEIARQKVKDQLELERQLEELEEAQVDPEDAKLVLPDDSQIAVTPKSTKGDVENPEINPLVLISPTFPPGSNNPFSAETGTTTTVTTTTTTTTRTTTTASTAKPTVKEILDATTTTLKSLDDVLDVPTRMQDTLMRLMKKTGGLKRDPFAKLVTTAVTLIDENQDFEDFTVPAPHQDPFLSQNLRGQDDGRFQGLSTPPSRQNPLLRQLQKERNEQLELDLPADPLNDPGFKPARPHQRFNPDALNLPSRRQNPLLRILRFDRREKILSKGLSPPRYRQNPLFRQLINTPQRYTNDFLQLPPKQQNKLLAILKRHGGDNFDADALLSLPQPSDDDYYDDDQFDNDEEPSEYEDYGFEEFIVNTTPTTTQTRRPIKMPKSKFEVLEIRGQPVEEVTFQRVNEPLTLKDKKEGMHT